MPLILGTLAFKDGDGPDQLPITATVDGQAIVLSDGTRYFQDVAVTPSAITWTGTFETNDNFGTPYQKKAYVESLRDGVIRTQLTFDGLSWSGFVQAATMTIVSAWRVKYSITFEVEVVGTLTTSGIHSQSHADRASAALDRINVLVQQGLSGTTQAANALMQINRISAGY